MVEKMNWKNWPITGLGELTSPGLLYAVRISLEESLCLPILLREEDVGLMGLLKKLPVKTGPDISPGKHRVVMEKQDLRKRSMKPFWRLFVDNYA